MAVSVGDIVLGVLSGFGGQRQQLPTQGELIGQNLKNAQVGLGTQLGLSGLQGLSSLGGGLMNALGLGAGFDPAGTQRANTVAAINDMLRRSRIGPQTTEQILANPQGLLKQAGRFGFGSARSYGPMQQDFMRQVGNLRALGPAPAAGGAGTNVSSVFQQLQTPTYQEGYGPQEWQAASRQAEDQAMQDYMQAARATMGNQRVAGLGPSSIGAGMYGQAGAQAAREQMGLLNQQRQASIETGRGQYNTDVQRFNEQRQMLAQLLQQLLGGMKSQAS